MTRLIASEWADNVGYGAGEMLMVHCVSAPQLTRLAARYPRGIGGPAVPENDSVWLLFGMAACLAASLPWSTRCLEELLRSFGNGESFVRSMLIMEYLAWMKSVRRHPAALRASTLL
jgi:hypothetical protein